MSPWSQRQGRGITTEALVDERGLLGPFKGFKKDPAFDQAFKSIRGSHQYDQYDGPDGIAWRLNTLCWAARCALRVGGDFIECGVFKGDMSWVVAQVIGAERIPHFYLFELCWLFGQPIFAK